jgi:F-type H+-transporting ATPase subunit gamma
MSSLREVKDRIASVRSTLKITSAMKLVASSKLRKAQRAIEALRPYEQTLAKILSSIPGDFSAPASPLPEMTEGVEVAPTVILAFSSNTSMCGGFNANVIRLALQTISGAGGPVEV